MKNNQKKDNSLTAKERKAQRRGDTVQKDVKVEAADVLPAGVVSVGHSAPSERMERNKPIIIALAVVFAAVMIVTALLITLVLAPLYAYRDINNPVAVISLSNGDRIELEIFEKEIPNNATNFLYLASKGFFDDTIIFDNTNKYVRFGQYQSDEYQNTSNLTLDERLAYEAKIYRSRNPEFLKRITDITPPSSYDTDSVFDYMMNQDTAASANDYRNLANKFGYISNIYTLSGTEFQICGETDQPTYINRKSTSSGTSTAPLQMSGYVIGYCANQQSLDVVKKLGEMEQSTVVNTHPYWTAPAQTIRIKRVRLYKMDTSGKWRNFNWDNWFGGNGSVRWSGGGGIKG